METKKESTNGSYHCLPKLNIFLSIYVLDNIAYNAKRIRSFIAKADRWTIKVKSIKIMEFYWSELQSILNMGAILLHNAGKSVNQVLWFKFHGGHYWCSH